MSQTAADDLKATINAQQDRAWKDLSELVSKKSVADPRQFPVEECHDTADWIVDRLHEVGFDDAKAVQTPDGTNSVIGHSPRVEGAPTVLLYCHYDVQPPLGEDKWHTPPFTLTERDGRWYGRGAADCKGNIVAHLIALRTFAKQYPLNITWVSEGSEEQGTGGFEQYAAAHPDEIAADCLMLVDAGNATLGLPTLTTTLRGLVNVVVTVRSSETELHSGMFGGPAPDALLGLIRLLATLRNEQGDTTIDGIDSTGVWPGLGYDRDQFRSDTRLVEGAEIIGSGRIEDMLWARPTLTVLGIDAPSVVGSSASIPASAAARLNLRIPPGLAADDARDRLVAHLKRHVPWGLEIDVAVEGQGEAFSADTTGPAYDALRTALSASYGKDVVTVGQGGSIPLANVLRDLFPQAEIALYGVEEPKCSIHATNESVDPSEILRIAEAEARFLAAYAGAKH